MLERAPRGGTIGVDGKFYRGGEILPFYVPRPRMPQIDAIYMAEFERFALARGVPLLHMTVEPEKLHPHQRIDKIRVQRMAADVRDKPIYASVDFYILDGNHRWKLHLLQHTPVKIVQIALPFFKAIELMFQFPNTYCLETHDERN